jgi:hypothetical protein
VVEYYTLDTVRDQVLQNGLSIIYFYFAPIGNLRPFEIVTNFPSDWKYYPCTIEMLCTQRKTRDCVVRIGITTNTNLNTAFNDNPNASFCIDAIFLRGGQNGIVNNDQAQLQCFIEVGKIREDALRIINT